MKYDLITSLWIWLREVKKHFTFIGEFEKNERNNQIPKVYTNVAEIRFHKMLYNIQASEILNKIISPIQDKISLLLLL